MISNNRFHAYEASPNDEEIQIMCKVKSSQGNPKKFICNKWLSYIE